MGALALIPAALLVGLLVWAVVSLDTRRTIKLTRLLAYLSIAVVLVVSTLQIVNLAASETLNLTIPVQRFWPALPESAIVSGQTAQIVGGGVTEATLDIQGLATVTRVLLGTSVVLQVVVTVFISAAVISLCNGHLKGTAFRSVMVKWFSATALVIIVCGLGWQILDDIAGYQASQQALGVDASQWEITGDVREELTQVIGQVQAANFSIEINFWPLWAGLALFATAQAFKRGNEIQKDLAGLI